MNRKITNILVTGGAGFIGTNFIRFLLLENGFRGRIINLDKLTYAGNIANMREIRGKFNRDQYVFKKADIQNRKVLFSLMRKYQVDTIIHFAAESHVDRSILGPKEFIFTNVIGTFTLLEAARACWGGRQDVLFHHVSTDEVFGSLGSKGFFTEETPYKPNSPYSASKAGSDHLVRAYHHTYGLPVTISNCSNNYGPYQYPEKMIPLMILNALENRELPVYGDGAQVRDWLYVGDHARAVWMIVNKGRAGETYNVGGGNEWKNIDMVNFLCEKISRAAARPAEEYKKLIRFVKDRPGHDKRYAIDFTKIKNELGWKALHDFNCGLEKTIDWYMKNGGWIRSVRRRGYGRWMKKHYG